MAEVEKWKQYSIIKKNKELDWYTVISEFLHNIFATNRPMKWEMWS